MSQPRIAASFGIAASSSRHQNQAVLSFFSPLSLFLFSFISYLLAPGHFVPEGGWMDCVHPGADLYVVLGTSTSRSAWPVGAKPTRVEISVLPILILTGLTSHFSSHLSPSDIRASSRSLRLCFAHDRSCGCDGVYK
ncbi:hypothetical protein OBBRIDRAFT_237438 [Obba rivulosa]|uniref:Uncharacterized protein n=1 Tax=Obba rivulosa TaxID=1052685 RepID=A0A8E2J7C9_9APHY|nr:hypothetical protein OBBRIDRAFT_237438 [Obba rivulosa]